MEEVYAAGVNLEQLCELGQAAKSNFRAAVEDFQARWGVVQLRAGLRVEKLRSAVLATDEFLNLNFTPLLDWMNEAAVVLSPDWPIGGDLSALESIGNQLQVSTLLYLC